MEMFSVKLLMSLCLNARMMTNGSTPGNKLVTEILSSVKQEAFQAETKAEAEALGCLELEVALMSW